MMTVRVLYLTLASVATLFVCASCVRFLSRLITVIPAGTKTPSEHHLGFEFAYFPARILALILLSATLLAGQSVTVSPTSLSFGNQAVATTGIAKNVTLKNGLTTSITISSIAVSGDYSQTNTCGSSLAVGAKCTISVSFTPTTTGSRTGTLTVTDNASNSPQTTSLTGTGVAQATLKPASLSFGNQVVGIASAAKAVTLTNNLPTSLTVSSITISGDYGQTNNCGTSVAAGASCTISVTLTPTTTGSRTGTLTVTDSANNSPQTVSLTGTGVVPVKVSPATVAFGNQAVTTTSAAKTVTVSNNQPTAVSISSITTPTAYAQTNTCGALLAAQASCTVSVTFSPTTTGSQPGTLTITDNASNSPQTVNLTGTGTALPSITSLSTTSGNVGAPVTITGTGFGTSQGGSSVTFNGATAAVTTWKSTSLTTTVPTAATTGNVVVTVNGGPSNGVAFTVVPNISSLSTTSGVAGTPVTLTGTGFGSLQGSSSVTIGGVAAAVTSWGSTSIAVSVPTSATGGSGTVVVTVNGVASNGAAFTVVPNITNLLPGSGSAGTAVTISGTGFGSIQNGSTVAFNGANATPTTWSAGSITVPVPAAATTGNVIVTVGGVASSGAAFTVLSGSGFVATTGQMGSARYGHTATQLTSTQVLIAGGMSSSGAVSTAELYNLASQSFAATNGMNVPRWLHTATLLGDGTVLITGGSSLSNGTTLNSAEIYDPVAGSFTLLQSQLNTARAGHTATLLGGGQVLLVGGYDPTTGIIADAELYDPGTQAFIDLGNTNAPRFHHSATLLQNGQVLIAGGETDPTPSGAYNTAEVFNPLTWRFTALPANMTTGREGHSATLLNDGTVLLAGGDLPGAGSLSTAEIFSPSSSTFSAISATMSSPRIFHDAVLLNGGKVLLSGGVSDAGGSTAALSTAELYDPTAQTFTAASGNMTTVREHQTATLLNDGTVLEDGGTDGTNIFNTAEIYTTSKLTGLASISVTPASLSIPAGAQQLLTATGTFSGGGTQTLSSVIWSSSSASVLGVSNDASNSGDAAGIIQGTATVTATAAGVSGSASVTIPAPTLVSIVISPQSPLLPLGTAEQLTATGVYSDGSVQDLTSSATWTTSAPAATVSSSGLVTGVSLGTSNIQAASGSQSASTSVTVGAAVLVSLVLNPANASIALGGSEQYQVTGTYSDGSSQDVTASVEWSCAPCSSVYVATAGLVYSLAQGTATIHAALGTVSGFAILTVTPAALTSLTISPNPLSIDVGGTQQLSASGTYSNFSGTDLTASSTWMSSNPAVATVSATGFVTALTAGSTTITATSGSVSGTDTLTVGTATGSALNTSRYGQSATLLNNGMVLIAGGVNCPSGGPCSYLWNAELYDPDSGQSTNTSNLATARSAPAVLLPNGKVLFAGGYACDSGGNCNSLSSAEVFQMPFSFGYFTGAGNMTVARSGQTVTLLNNGRVLIAGGQNCTSATSCTTLNTAEIYDPIAGSFTATGNLNAARYNAVAVTLNSGLVLIAGGFDGTSYPAAAEIYDPTSGTFTPAGSLITPRANATATALNTGQVLVAGGSNCAAPGCPLNAAELYDPVAGTFSSTGQLNVTRFNHSATLLTNGQVLVAGGFSSCSTACTSDSTAEVYDPVAGTFSSTSALSTARSGQTATLVPSGDVVIAGGTSAGTTISSIDFYQPSALTPPGLLSITVTPANASIPGRMSQQFVALGTFSGGSTQTLRSAVWTSSNPTVTGITNDSSGTGYVYSTTNGSTVLTASAGTVNGSTLVNTAPSLSYLTVTPPISYVLVGQTLQFSVKGTYTDGSTADLTASATWSSSNPGVAIMSSTPGLVTTLATGSSTIIASASGLTANSPLMVQAATPTIASLSSSSGPIGGPVSIGGTNFGDLQGASSVTFNSVPAQVFSWSRVVIVVYVPAGASTGPVQVTAGGTGSNTMTFTITQAVPLIAGISELTGAVGDTITISGSGFGSSGMVSFNGIAGNPISWSDSNVVTQIPIGAQTGPVTITSGSQTSNSVTLTIASAPSVIGVSPGSGDAGTVITISGTNFTTPSNGPVVLFNGTAVQPATWNSSQIVATVPKGATTGPLTVRVGRLASNATTFTIAPAASQTLSIAPANSTLVVGQTVNLSLSDDLEHNITGAVWSLSDNTLAQLSNTNPPVLTANKIGNETVTATYNGLSATATVTITASGVTMPLGTVVCSLPSNTSAYTVLKILQAVPSDGTTPDLIAVEDDGVGSIWLRGLSSGCTQQWHTRVGSSASGSGVDVVQGETPDNLGGVVVAVANNLNSQTGPSTSSLIRVDGVSGSVTWRYDSPGNFSTDVAIDQSGYSLVTENYMQNPYLLYSASELVKIDPNTGVPVATWGWPSSTFLQIAGCTILGYSETIATGSGPITVGPDGSYYLTIAWSNTVSWPAPTLDSVNDCSDMTTNSSTTTFSQLMTITPSGGVSTTNLPNAANGAVIPDGNGGALVQVPMPGTINQPSNQIQVMDIGGGNGTATISDFTGGDTVLGDQGTYFMTDGNKVISVNEASGSEVWRWQPNSGNVQIIAATAGGGVAVKNIIQPGQENVVRLDANGSPTYDTWGTAGGGAGYGVVSNSKYFAGLWAGVGGDPVIEQVMGTPMEEAFTPWPDPAGGAPNNGGAKQAIIYHFLPKDPGKDFPITGNNGNNYEALIENSVPDGPNANVKIPIKHVFVAKENATVGRFVTALRSGAAAVSFIGDSVGFAQGTDNAKRYGLEFFTEVLASPDIPAGANLPGYTIVKRSFSDIAPDTQVFFLGACFFDSTMSQWIVPAKSSGQAFIVPKTSSPTFLGASSEAWAAMLVDLAGAQGGTVTSVSTAVDDGNKYLTKNPPQPIPPLYVQPVWKYTGDGSVKIKATE
ncbi:MAG TPA: choice-of-anchor D domain-containing protein [Candidatus Dormibacteraeota bacterium]|nr:choice-of-anchor D domain-containing protein [Candidatus Dormibacteraeota bacterium]